MLRRALAAAIVFLLLAAGAAAALTALPGDGSQLNNDPTAGIAPTLDAGSADVTAGALSTTAAPVPWAAFEQKETGAQQQIFVRALNNGAWATKGHTTVNGSGQTTFPSSLNFDETEDAESPAITFAGTGSTVPWTAFSELTAALGNKRQIFASRFDSVADAWVFAGQARGGGAIKPPSLNIDAAQDAGDPAIVGGTMDATKAPVPWVAWDEGTTTSQIFVAKAVKLDVGAGPCPAGTKPTGGTAVGGFCWQQTGIERQSGNTKPSLNVDISRTGVEPDIAFAGPSRTVPWVVWYEEAGPGQFGVTNERVFAAKAASDGSGDGGLHWQAVGNGTTGLTDTLNTSTTTNCVASKTDEDKCTLNKGPDADAEDPRVAAGTMTAGQSTVPWVVWVEDVQGHQHILASRLVGGDHFALANGGNILEPPALAADNSSRPDITFAGTTPYVSWRTQVSAGHDRLFVGHFVNAASPTFVLDTPDGIAISSAGPQLDVRAALASACALDCQGGAVGSPMVVFNDGSTGAQKLFAQGYAPATPVTGAAAGSVISGSVDPQGGPVEVHFDFGPTSAYGQATAAQPLAPASGATAFSADLGPLAAGTTIHYRAVARGDFGALAGADQTLTIPVPPPSTTPATTPVTTPPGDHKAPTVRTTLHKVKISQVKAHGTLKVSVTLSEAGKVTVSLRIGSTVIGSGSATFARAGKKTIVVKLSKSGRRRLRHTRHPKLSLKITAVDRAGNKAKAITVKLKS